VLDGVVADSRFADPADEVPVPVRTVAGAAVVRPVWTSGGGTTFRIDGDPERFVKWRPYDSGEDLEGEARRLRWAHGFALVPQFLEQGSDETGSWLVTAALPGESAISPRWKADPELAVRVAGASLRSLHDELPVSQCPFEWSVETRRRNVHPTKIGHPKLTETAPDIDKLVVCHGDACVPNTLITPDRRFAGHVDLGDLGVADRWADLAVGTWSTEWNYGPGWEALYLDSYGIAADDDRIRFYRDLWDLVHPV
jgi:kanamycin kinase